MQGYQSEIDKGIPPFSFEDPVKWKKQEDDQGDLTTCCIPFKKGRIMFPVPVEESRKKISKENADECRTILSAVRTSDTAPGLEIIHYYIYT